MIRLRFMPSTKLSTAVFVVLAATLVAFGAKPTAAMQTLPAFRLPWATWIDVRWTSGPHSYSMGGQITATVPERNANGLDFGLNGGGEFAVLNMATGTVLKDECFDLNQWGLGCYVAIRHTVGGSIMVYGHLKPNASFTSPANDIAVGQILPQGTILGTAGQSGLQEAIHLHIELRDGVTPCTAGADCIPPVPGSSEWSGNPIPWSGRILVDNYTIAPYCVVIDGGDCSSNIYNYDGSAFRGSVAAVVFDFPFMDGSSLRRTSASVHPTFSCADFSQSCEIDQTNGNTVFAAKGQGLYGGGRTTGPVLLSSNAPLAPPQATPTPTVLPATATPMPPTPTAAIWAYQLFGLGDYNGEKFESSLSYPNLNVVSKSDWAQSMRVNTGYEIIACTDAYFQGNCGRARGPRSMPDINELAQGMRNAVTSIMVCVGACPTPTPVCPPNGCLLPTVTPTPSVLPTATAGPPASPGLLAPADGTRFTTDTSISVMLRWSPAANAQSYQLELICNGVRREPTGRIYGLTEIAVGVLPGYQCSWQVEAYNSAGQWSGWSGVSHFWVEAPTPTPTVAPPARPVLLSPANGAKFTPADAITLQWSAAQNAASYLVELVCNGVRREPTSRLYGVTSVEIGTLAPQACRWQVEAYNVIGQWSGWSGNYNFTVDAPTPTASSTATLAPTVTNTPSPTATDTPEPTATGTPEPTATGTPEPTATGTPMPTETPIPTPGRPILLFPADDAFLPLNTDIILRWQPGDHNATYSGELWGPSGVARPANVLTATQWEIGALPEGSYSWQIEGYNLHGEWSGWTPPWHFTVGVQAPEPTPTELPTELPVSPPGKPTLDSPADFAVLPSGADIVLHWQPGERNVTYIAELWGPSGAVWPQVELVATQWMVGSLPEGDYAWHVEGYDEQGRWSGWSNVSHFTVGVPTPTALPTESPTPVPTPGRPFPISPDDFTHMLPDTNVVLRWQPGEHNVTYLAELWGASGVIRPPTVLADTQWVLGSLPEGTYFWQVEGYDVHGGWSGWSDAKYFVISSLGLKLAAASPAVGAPGSLFVFRGEWFPPMSEVEVLVNQAIVGQIESDATGTIQFALQTHDRTTAGQFDVTARSLIGQLSASAVFTVNTLAEIQTPSVPEGAILILNGAVLNNQLFLPAIHTRPAAGRAH
jgi:hypothetical protein